MSHFTNEKKLFNYSNHRMWVCVFWRRGGRIEIELFTNKLILRIRFNVGRTCLRTYCVDHRCSCSPTNGVCQTMTTTTSAVVAVVVASEAIGNRLCTTSCQSFCSSRVCLKRTTSFVDSAIEPTTTTRRIASSWLRRTWSVCVARHSWSHLNALVCDALCSCPCHLIVDDHSSWRLDAAWCRTLWSTWIDRGSICAWMMTSSHSCSSTRCPLCFVCCTCYPMWIWRSCYCCLSLCCCSSCNSHCCCCCCCCWRWPRRTRRWIC